jgi:SsrA-binding protein
MHHVRCTFPKTTHDAPPESCVLHAEIRTPKPELMTAFAENRKARHDYETLEKYGAGIVLTGAEVKAVREGGANLAGSHLGFGNGELWIKEMKIAPYSKAGRIQGYDASRPRKILMRKQELKSLLGKTEQKGLTLIPLSLYDHGRHIKLTFGLCRGRKTRDKRDVIKRRDIDRDVRRHLEE